MAEGITLKRIIDMDEAAELTSSDYALVDSATGGPKKFAIGQELGEIKDGLTNAYGGIAITNLIKDKYIITENGNLGSYYGWSVTEYFEVFPELPLTIISNGPATSNNLFYDSNKNPIQPRITINAGLNYFYPPSNAKFVRFSGANNMIETMKIFINIKSDASLSVEGGYADAKTVGDFRGKILKADGGIIINNIIPNKYLIIEDGSEASYYGWSATDFIDVTEGTVLQIYVSEATSWNMFYDSEKVMIQPNIILTAGLNFIKVVDDAKYVRFSATDAVINGLKIWVSREIPEIPEDPTLIIPEYYDSYLQDKIADIQEFDDDIGYGGDRFIFITDTHNYYGNTGHSPALINKIQDATYIGMTVFGGDAINAANTESILKYRFSEFFKEFRLVRNFYPIIGNHEFYSDWEREGDYKGGITFSEVYSYFNKSLERIVTDGDGLAAYYIDNTIKKIRYYFVGCDYYVAIPTQTKTWIINSIQSIPSGYTVVFMGHRIANIAVTDIAGDFADIHPYIVAMNTVGNSICPLVLCGHTHLDGMFVKDGIHYVATTTDNHTLEENPNLTRTEGTTNEQAFDVVSIDTINKHIYFTRIGGGSDRDFSYS